MYLLGQIFGWAAALLTFLSYQCKEHKKLIIVQTASSVSICISYFMLGAYSGNILNIVCIVRNLLIYNKFTSRVWACAFAGIMGLVGFLSWQGPLSLVIIAGLVINTLFLFSSNVQNLRKSILLTSTLVLLYNVYYNVWGGVINEAIAIISAIIGLIRYRK